MDDGLIGIREMAVRAICGRLTAVQLQGMQRSVEQACVIPKHIGWDRKATAHTEALKTSADGIFYLNERGFSSTIRVRS